MQETMQTDLKNLLEANSEIVSLDEDRLKVDRVVGLESAWVALGVVALLLLIYGIATFREATGALPYILIIAGIALGALSVALTMSSDNYYIIDRKQQDVSYHRKLLSRVEMRSVAAFADIAAVTVDGRLAQQHRGLAWEYYVVLVLNNRKIIKLSDSETDYLELYSETARVLADFIGAPFQPGEPESIIRVAKHPATGAIEIRHVDKSPKGWRMLLMFVVVAGLALAAAVKFLPPP